MKKIILVMAVISSAQAFAGVDSIKKDYESYERIGIGSDILPPGGSLELDSRSITESLKDHAEQNQINLTNTEINDGRIRDNKASIETTNENVSSLKNSYNGHELRIRNLEMTP
ncbi:hypothetical protein LRP52_48205 [Photobacterium sp. ZSDE20]|nr:hypothetical protein [Photobacterium sp. ZSDE20]